MNEQRIWLIDMGDGDRDWCDSLSHQMEIDPEDVTGPDVIGADRTHRGTKGRERAAAKLIQCARNGMERRRSAMVDRVRRSTSR